MYRGRSPMMITGKDNYALLSKNLNRDFIKNPDELLLPEYTMLAAADYWKTNKLNAFADGWRITALSKKINGGDVGLKERIEFCTWALTAYTEVAKHK